MKVVVIGMGYVGLPLAVRAAEMGHDVSGIDVDCAKVGSLLAGRTYIEDVSDERLAAVLASGNFRASGRLRDPGFDIGIITVPTPLRDGTPDLSYVESAGRTLGKALRPGAAVVLESTTYPGTTEELLCSVLCQESGLPPTAFHLGFSPERIDPGNTTYTLENTPKVVSATSDAGLAVIKAFYDTIVDTTVPVSSPRVAEMTKLFENIQAYVLIGLINEVSELCHRLDIDVWEMIDASMTKGHSMSRWTPGPGVGGHCLPIDPLYLAYQAQTELGVRFRFAETAHDINSGRPAYVARRALEAMNRRGRVLHGARVLLLGVAYKPNVGDVRESPAFGVVKAFQALGAEVSVSDPIVQSWDLTPVVASRDLLGEIELFDLAVIVTDHAAFDYDKIRASAQFVLDCRNVMAPGPNVEVL